MLLINEAAHIAHEVIDRGVELHSLQLPHLVRVAFNKVALEDEGALSLLFQVLLVHH